MPLITSTTPITVDVTRRKLPLAVVLTSSYGSRAIKYVADPEAPTVLTTVTPDVTAVGQLIAICTGPVAAIVVTGQAGDTYNILEQAY